MSEQAEIQRTIEKALAKRNKARSKKMWSVADDIRNMLKEMGVLIQDTGPNTSEWRWAKGALQDSEARMVVIRIWGANRTHTQRSQSTMLGPVLRVMFLVAFGYY